MARARETLPLVPSRVRQIRAGFSWVDRRFVRDRWMERLDREEILLYLFLGDPGTAAAGRGRRCARTTSSLRGGPSPRGEDQHAHPAYYAAVKRALLHTDGGRGRGA